MFTKKTLLAPAIAATLLSTMMIATPAAAKSVRVSHADLNLGTVEGQAVLQQRIDGAIRRICRFDDQGKLNNPYIERACTRDIRANINPRIAAIIENNRLGG